MLQTLWEHYLHDPTNTNYARRIYPLFAGATQFFLETTVPYAGNSCPYRYTSTTSMRDCS
jgi:hypothetical protein